MLRLWAAGVRIVFEKNQEKEEDEKSKKKEVSGVKKAADTESGMSASK